MKTKDAKRLKAGSEFVLFDADLAMIYRRGTIAMKDKFGIAVEWYGGPIQIIKWSDPERQHLICEMEREENLQRIPGIGYVKAKDKPSKG